MGCLVRVQPLLVEEESMSEAGFTSRAGRITPPPSDGRTCLDFYGLRCRVESDSPGVLEDIRRDFSYFLAKDCQADMKVTVVSQPAPRQSLPALRAALHTPRNTVYREGNTSYIDYFGRAMTICQGGEFRVYCTDRDLAHEIAFLTILSHMGRHLDAKGLHRVHALGVEAGGKAVLILLPVAGGKTTLAVRLLAVDGAKLLSEDSPLISRRGEVLPFPLRIGLRANDTLPGVPAQYCRTVQRMEFGPKTLVDIEYFRDKIASPCPAGAVLLGQRWLSGPSCIQPDSGGALKAFVKNSVVGLGLYQGMEFVLERSAWEILGKVGTALRRLVASMAVIRRSQVYSFRMGPDVEQNAQVLKDFLLSFAAKGSV